MIFSVRHNYGATTFNMTTFRIMAQSIKGLLATLSIKYTQHKTLLIECHYDECRDFFIVMLSVIMLNVVAPLSSMIGTMQTYFAILTGHDKT